MTTLPRLIMVSVWPLKSLCVFYDASINKLNTNKESNINVNFMWLVPFRYLNTVFSVPQSSLFKFLTLVVSNETYIWMYPMDCELINRNYDTEWWNISSVCVYQYPECQTYYFSMTRYLTIVGGGIFMFGFHPPLIGILITLRLRVTSGLYEQQICMQWHKRLDNTCVRATNFRPESKMKWLLIR